jgi:hypothetical protein
MRTTLTILLLVAALILASGCTSATPSATPATASPAPQPVATNTAIPGMTGVWQGPVDGYAQHVFAHYPNMVFNITTQQGQVFVGKKEYLKADGKTYYENFTGIVTSSGEIYTADEQGGVHFGKLTGPGAIVLYYLEEGSDTKALVLQLTRNP